MCCKIDEPRLRPKWAQACADALGQQPAYELGSGDRSAPVYSYGRPVLVVRPDRRSPFVLLEAQTLGVPDAPDVLVRLGLDDWLTLLARRANVRTRREEAA